MSWSLMVLHKLHNAFALQTNKEFASLSDEKVCWLENAGAVNALLVQDESVFWFFSLSSDAALLAE